MGRQMSGSGLLMTSLGKFRILTSTHPVCVASRKAQPPSWDGRWSQHARGLGTAHPAAEPTGETAVLLFYCYRLTWRGPQTKCTVQMGAPQSPADFQTPCLLPLDHPGVYSLGCSDVRARGSLRERGRQPCLATNGEDGGGEAEYSGREPGLWDSQASWGL